MNNRLVALLSGAVLIAAFQSCAVGADATVAPDGRMALDVSVDLNPVFQAYLKDLAGTEADAKGGFFDMDRIKTRIESAGGIVVKDLKKLSPGKLALALDIKDPSQVFSNDTKGFKGVFQTGKRNGDAVLTLTLNRTTVKSIMNMAASEAGDEAEYLLPKKEGISAAEYRKNLDWALEDYGSKAERNAMFDTAWINLNIQLPRAVKSAKGFDIKNKSMGSIALKVSLIDLMVIQEEKTYEVVY